MNRQGRGKNIRKALWIKGLIFTVFWSISVQAASADPSGSPLAGKWSGTYSCGNIMNNPFTLSLDEASQRDIIEGEFRFAVPDSDSKSGAYRVFGRHDPSRGTITFVPAGWIDRPKGVDALGFDGQTHDNGLSISGRMRGCIGPNAAFFAERTDKVPSGRTQEQIPPPSARSGGPWEGAWEGSIECSEKRGSLPYRISMLQDDDRVVATYDIAWPHGRPGNNEKRRGVATGEITPEGRLGLEHRIWLSKYMRWSPGFDASIGPSGDSIEGEATGLPMNYKCRRVVLNRTGEASPPLTNDSGLSTGVWAGYSTPYKGSQPEEWLEGLVFSGSQQVVLTLAQDAGLLRGSFAGAAPVLSPPSGQDRYAYSFHPITQLSDGRIAFMPLKVQNAQGSFKTLARSGWYSRDPFLITLSLEEDNALSLGRIDSRLREKSLQLVPQKDEAIVALQGGEAPAVPLPGAIAGKLRGAPSLDRQCAILHDWAAGAAESAEILHMTSRQIRKALLPLLEPQRFEPVFGVPFNLSTEEERLGVYKLSRVCSRRTTDRLGEILIGEFRSRNDFDQLSRLAMNQAESSQWLQETLAEIEALEEVDDTLAKLSAFEREARRRRTELSEGDREALERSIADKRHRIAVANFVLRVEAIPSLPAQESSVGQLTLLFEKARRVDLPAKTRARLVRLSSDKASDILRPILVEARHSLDNRNASLDALAEMTTLQRRIEGIRTQLVPEVRQSLDFEPAADLAERRKVLIRKTRVQKALEAQLMSLKATHGEPAAAVRNTALRYLDREHLEGPSAIPYYAQLVEKAGIKLELKSVGLVDHSARKSKGEPDIQEMYFAVKAKFDQINRNLSETYERCQRRQFQNDPLAAMECLTILASGGGGKLRARITRFEKFGCAEGRGQAGYVCDYVLGFETNSPYMRGRLGDLLSNGSVSQGRFIPLSRVWQFIPLRRDD